MFHAVWTDNRDVRPPKKNPLTGLPDWTKYTPAKMSPNQLPQTSLFDGSIVPECRDDDGNPGSRNQNVYSSRITGSGLLAGSPGNAKPLSTDYQRGFVQAPDAAPHVDFPRQPDIGVIQPPRLGARQDELGIMAAGPADLRLDRRKEPGQ